MDDWAPEKLMTFDADAGELEDGGEIEPDHEVEENWLPVVLLDLAGPKVMRRRRASARTNSMREWQSRTWANRTPGPSR